MCDALPAPPASAVERSRNLIWYRYKIGPTHEPTPHKLNIHSLPTHSSCSLSLQTPRDKHDYRTEKVKNWYAHTCPELHNQA